ncbi:hypothetical protein ACH4D8_22035 [Streptomyces roseolus]
MRRASALIMLLIAALFAHAVTPHHTTPASPVAVKPAAVVAEDRRSLSGADAARLGGQPFHHESSADPLVVQTRGQGGSVEDADLLAAGEDATATDAGAGVLALASTARERWRPAFAGQPTTASLQIFRC